MNPRRIDGIYRRDIGRRYESERRLVVPARPTLPLPQTSHLSLDGMVSSQQTAPSLLATPTLATAPERPERAVAHTTDANSSHPTPTIEPTVVATPIDTGGDRSTRRSRFAAHAFVVAGVLVLIGTGVLGYQTWQTNVRAQAAFSAPQQAADDSTTSSTNSAAQDAAPTEAAVSDADKSTYTVAADLPRTISIDRIGVHARVLQLGLTADGAIDAPKGIWDAGWYDGSAKPGQGGNVFIDGHISGPTQPAVFAKLKVLHEGDFITVEKGDGTTITYKVSTVTTQKLTDIDMASVLAGPGGESLTLMTCGGNYQGDYIYDSRVIVVAKRV